MVELTAEQIAEPLRRCSSSEHCDGCPYQMRLHDDCIGQLQADAAALIEGLAAMQ